MAEEDDAMEGLIGEDSASDDAGEGGGEDLDPLAEEMLKMMEEEGDEGDDLGSQGDVDQMMEAEMLKAMEEEGGAGGVGEGLGGMGLGGGGAEAPAAGGGMSPSVARLMDVPLLVTIELGRTRMILQEVMNLGEQSLVELSKGHGEPVDVLVNGRLFARGEVVTVQENFGIRITELLPGALSF